MNKNFKNGFSLAEAMIMLTIVSIIMAVSVPLIAKKAQVDTRTLLAHSTYNKITVNGTQTDYTTSTSGGFGNNNAFGIGIKKAFAKFHIRGNSGSQNAHEDDQDVIFRADVQDDNNNADGAPNYRGFKVYGDGTTNVRTCVPDYTTNPTQLYSFDGVNAAGNITANITDDGYLISTGQCVTITYTANSYTYCPPVVLSTAVGSPLTDVGPGGIGELKHVYTGSIIIPVSKGGVYTVVVPASPYYNSATAVLYQIPCAIKPNR